MAKIIIREDQKEKLEMLASVNNLSVVYLQSAIEAWFEINFAEWDYDMQGHTIEEAFMAEHNVRLDIYKDEAMDMTNIHEASWAIFANLIVHGSGECSCGGDFEPKEIGDTGDVADICNQCNGGI
jgi:hypothetical protein